jgi:trehalose/maltose transport system substrate-binding protein
VTDSNRQIGDLFKEFRRGDINRREFLTRGTALGISAVFLGRMVTDKAFAQDASPAAAAPGYSLKTPAGFDQSLAGQKITVVMGSDGPGTPFEQACVKLFTETTGVEVNYIAGAQSTTDRLSNYLQILNAQASDIDAMMIDVIHPGILAIHALDLTDAMKANNVEYFKAIVDNNTVDGKLVGIPFYTDAGLLYYRKDLLEKYSISAPPATWTDLETSAKTIMDGERGGGAGEFWGFVWQGNAYEGLTCDALEWQVSNGGGNIIEPDGTITVNNPQAIASFERAKAWIGTITPEGVTTYQEEDARNVWQGGNSAFMRNWPYAYAPGQGADSVIKDKFAVTLLPKGDGENARNAATLGGWQMMASKYSKSPDAAILFCRFMTSTVVERSSAIERALLPTIASVYDDPDVLKANPYYADLKPVFQGGAVPRPSTVSSTSYNDVSTSYFTHLHNILTGSGDAASEVKAMADELKTIMDELNS